MTEETKKPRRKRRTKAQIEADKAAAAELAAKEDNGRFSDPSSFAEEDVKEEPAVTKKAEEGYVPLTGLAKIRNKYAQRQEIDRSREL